MHKTINETDFVSAFADCGRADNFSVGARIALFEYFEELEESTGKSIELDVIAICCEFSEYGSAAEAVGQYYATPDAEAFDSIEEFEVAALDWLTDRTTVLPLPSGGVVVACF